MPHRYNHITIYVTSYAMVVRTKKNLI